MKFVKLNQDTPEWHEFRQNHIGASDAPVVMGVSPFKSRKQLWKEKVFGVQQKANGAMLYGKMKEEEAREAFERETGFLVFPKVLEHPEHDWISASLDGLDVEEKFLVEIKCPRSNIDQFVDAGNMVHTVPEKYFPQIQHQLFVTGLDLAYYYTYYGNGHGTIAQVRRDDKYIDLLLEKEKEFWEYVQTFIPPPNLTKNKVKRYDTVGAIP